MTSRSDYIFWVFCQRRLLLSCCHILSELLLMLLCFQSFVSCEPPCSMKNKEKLTSKELVALRKEADLSQLSLSQLTGIEVHQLDDIETGVREITAYQDLVLRHYFKHGSGAQFHIH
eukprot:g58159.t1